MAVKVGYFAMDSTKTAGQSQSVTGLGFTPDAVIFRWGSRTYAPDYGPVRVEMREGVGWMLTNGENASMSIGRQENADNASFRTCLSTDNCIFRMNYNGTNYGKASFGSMDSDGFTLSIDTAFSGNMIMYYTAISGKQFKQIELATPGSTGLQAYTGAGFEPTFAFFMGIHEAAYNTTYARPVRIGLGAAIGSDADQNFTWANYETHTGSGTTYTYTRRTECFSLMNYGPVERAQMSSLDSDGFTLDWQESATSGRKMIALVSDGNWWVSSETMPSDTNEHDLTGMTWTPEGALFISAQGAENAVDSITSNDALELSFGMSTGPATDGTEQVLCMTRYSFNGNSGGTREVFYCSDDKVMADVTGSNPPTFEHSVSVTQEFTDDTITVQNSGASADFFGLIAIGPPIVNYRNRLTRYLHNTYQSRRSGKTIFRDLVGRDVPPHQLDVDEWAFSGGILWPTPTKYENKLQDPNAFYFEQLRADDDRAQVETDRESFFQSIMRRLGRG